MTERKNPLAVRWSTEHEEADLSRLHVVRDDFAILLDRSGWQITPKPAFGKRLWPMLQKTTATPLWASDRRSHGPKRKIKYLPHPTAVKEIFAFGFDDESNPYTGS
jgi:hypothetical protein